MKPYSLDKNIDTIKDLYYTQGLSATAISRQYKASHTAILDVLERHGLKRRKHVELGHIYELNEDFFEIIDTSEKAYWLGFLYADGYNNCGDKRHVTLKLQGRDGYMIKRFRDALESTHPIVDVIDNGKPQVYIRICNKKLSMDLEKLGAGQCKSLILEFPADDQVPNHLVRHFIRGYFDGDGCITMNRNRPTHCQINFCLTRSFGEKLNKLLKEMVDVNGSLYRQPPNQIHHLAFSGRKGVLRFMNWMYHESDGLFMIRKHDRYEFIRSHILLRDRHANSSEETLVQTSLESTILQCVP